MQILTHQRAAITLSLLLASCAVTDLREAARIDSEAAYRSFLAQHAESDDASEAHTRLEELAWQRAQRGDDIASYNRFLAEFPEGDFAREAERRRARRRLERATAENDTSLLRRIIELDRGTAAADEARRQLETLEARELEASDDPARIRSYLLTFPQSDARETLERRLEGIEFERAQTSGSREALRHYLEAHPRGIHRSEARAALEELEATRVIQSGHPSEMERFLREFPGASAEQRVRRAAAKALIERARRRLDPEPARRVLTLDPEGPHADDAERLIDAFERPNRRLAKVRDLVETLRGGVAFRPSKELERALGSDDPLDHWNALRETALSDDPESIDIAVRAAGGSDPLAVFFARTAIITWSEQRSELARGRLEGWQRRLRKRISNPEDRLRLAVVSESLGEAMAATTSYREAAKLPPTQLAGAVHWALLTARHGSEDENTEALTALQEAAHGRLEELNESTPESIEEDQARQTLVLLRGLEGLARTTSLVLAANRDAAQPPPELAEEELAAAPDPLEDVQRLSAAANSSARRLRAALDRLDPDLVRDADDPIAARAAEGRRQQLDAARSLAKMRATRAVPALVMTAAEDDGQLGREALRALAQIASPEAIDGLVELANSAEAEQPVRHALLQALRDVIRRAPANRRAALEDLLENLNDHD